MTDEPKEWGFRATSRTAAPEIIHAGLALFGGIGLVLGVFLVVHQFQIHSYFASLPGETAATGRAGVAASVRPMDDLSRGD